MSNNVAILEEPVKRDDGDIHAFESVGSILRRLRADYESKMTPDFDPRLSLLIDDVVQQEDGEEARPC